MSANVEKMFYVNKDLEGKRFAPWHGLGTPVNEALSSAEAITMAGLDWKVVKNIEFIIKCLENIWDIVIN